MNLEVLNPEKLSLNDLINNMNSLYYITNGETYSETSLGLGLWPVSKHDIRNLQDKEYLIVKITEGEIPEIVEPEEEVVEKPVVEIKKKGRGIDRDYKFSGMNDDNTARIAWCITGNKYGGIRVSFQNKEDARVYHDYFREQFYNRDISSVDVSSIYEDLGVSKGRIEQECPNAWKWGYPTLFNGPCKYLTDVMKNKNDSWYGFTFLPPVIVNRKEI